MRLSLDELVRRLTLLGLPLLPVNGCTLSESSCPDNPRPVEQQHQFERPGASSDAGFQQISRAAFDRCQEHEDNMPLCDEFYRHQAIVQSCTRSPSDAGTNHLDIQARIVPFCEGRRPEGYLPPSGVNASCDLGVWLAHATALEAASVPAFRRLAHELDRHGAPSTLVARAHRAARDERRHTRLMSTLARRHGVQVSVAMDPAPRHVRPLEAVICENAVEGCLRETLGALVARWQATWAQNDHLRAAMSVIARDEATHAELAWTVDDWAADHLDPAARARGRETRRAAYADLLDEIDRTPPSPVLIAQAGIPSPDITRRLAQETDRVLWAAA